MKAVENEPITQIFDTIRSRVRVHEMDDDGLAFGLSQLGLPERDEAIGRIHSKYYLIAQDYIKFRWPKLSATAQDQIVDAVFDRLWAYSETHAIRTENGGLTSYIILLCVWEAGKVVRTETRRQKLLANGIMNLWCVQDEQAELFKENAVKEQDVSELLTAMKRELQVDHYLRTTLVLEAISALYMDRGGLQTEGLPLNPNISSLHEYINSHGEEMGKSELKHLVNVLRAIAKRVFKENGWDMDYPGSTIT